MQRLATKFTLTASLAALIFATPVSVDLPRSNATDGAHVAGIFSLNTAQAHPEREGAARNAGGGNRQAARNAGDRQGARANERTADNARAADIRANNGRANDIRANDIRANNANVNNARINNAEVNNANVNSVKVNDANVNNANVNNVEAAYVRPPYARPPYAQPWTTGVAVAGTAVAVGTTVAVLPASCTTVVYDDVTYHHCGSTYYVASDGAYVAVNPPR